MIPKLLLAEISRWIDEKRYGNIQINFAAGKIVNVNRNESVKVDSLLQVTVSNSTREQSID